MKIESKKFGSIRVDDGKYDHDIVIYPDRIERRKKRISKDKHGTSHMFTKEEMEEYLSEIDAKKLEVVVIGTGQYGKVELLEDTKQLLKEKEIKTLELKTP